MLNFSTSLNPSTAWLGGKKGVYLLLCFVFLYSSHFRHIKEFKLRVREREWSSQRSNGAPTHCFPVDCRLSVLIRLLRSWSLTPQHGSSSTTTGRPSRAILWDLSSFNSRTADWFVLPALSTWYVWSDTTIPPAAKPDRCSQSEINIFLLNDHRL